MTDIANLEAWAITQGYDPTRIYTSSAGPMPRPGKLSEHFHEDEFRCKCCGQLPTGGMSKSLIATLEQVRAHFGVSIKINSGYRCPKHNAAIGGAKNSQHMLGTAADIVVSGVAPSTVHAYLDPIHDGGLGSYKSFTHVDARDGRARWTG